MYITTDNVSTPSASAAGSVKATYPAAAASPPDLNISSDLEVSMGGLNIDG